MFKTTIAAAAAAAAAPAAALRSYVNVETNAGWTGDDYIGATTDILLDMKVKLVLVHTSSYCSRRC